MTGQIVTTSALSHPNRTVGSGRRAQIPVIRRSHDFGIWAEGYPLTGADAPSSILGQLWRWARDPSALKSLRITHDVCMWTPPKLTPLPNLTLQSAFSIQMTVSLGR